MGDCRQTSHPFQVKRHTLRGYHSPLHPASAGVLAGRRRDPSPSHCRCPIMLSARAIRCATIFAIYDSRQMVCRVRTDMTRATTWDDLTESNRWPQTQGTVSGQHDSVLLVEPLRTRSRPRRYTQVNSRRWWTPIEFLDLSAGIPSHDRFNAILVCDGPKRRNSLFEPGLSHS